MAPPAGAASAAAAAATPTEEDLTRYVEWTRDWKLLTNRHKAELDAVTDQVAAKYSPQETDRVVQDPEYVACLERQGTEMKAHFAGQPRGRMASGFQAVLEGIGSLVPQPHGYVYVPGRNPEALDKARQVHGDAFVDWVLEREDVIVATLSQ